MVAKKRIRRTKFPMSDSNLFESLAINDKYRKGLKEPGLWCDLCRPRTILYR